VIFGYTAAEVIGKNVNILMPEPHRKQHDGYLKRFLTSREPRIIGGSRCVEGLRKDGRVFAMRLGISNVMTPDGEIFIGLVHDYSEEVAHIEAQAALTKELAEAREQALRSERTAAFGHLAAGIAHEMNTPLGYVQSNLKVLRTYASDLLNLSEQLAALSGGFGRAESASTQQLLKEIDFAYLKDDIPKLSQEVQSGLERIGHIVDSLRDVARPGEPEIQRVELGQSVDSALTLLRGRLAPGLTIERDFGSEPVWIECTPADIGQVLLNLLQNAMQAAGATGTMGVRLRSEAGQVMMTVADNGPGIAAENLPHLFNPFFTTRPVGDGKGLGLYIAAGLVRRHGGRIEVDSRPGRGSRFTVHLPSAKIVSEVS
jgi:two-component system NtrC family sensor kinase